MNKIFALIAISISQFAFSASSFDREINEIQVVSGTVRLDVGVTYGTCGDREGWWGWSVNDQNHSSWLSLALSAQAQGKKITVYDEHSSCGGLPDVIQLEGLFLKSSS